MTRTLSRLLPALVALVIGSAFAAPATAAAQSAPVRAADAQAFLGEWAVTVDAQGQPVVIELDITDENGNVVAEVNDPMGGGTIRIDRISKTGDNLVLSYDLDAQGQQFPISVTLSPAADALNANIDVAGGMLTTTAKATRR
jgi:hypothetical protein